MESGDKSTFLSAPSILRLMSVAEVSLYTVCLRHGRGRIPRPKRIGERSKLAHLPRIAFVLHGHHILVGVWLLEKREGRLAFHPQYRDTDGGSAGATD